MCVHTADECTKSYSAKSLAYIWFVTQLVMISLEALTRMKAGKVPKSLYSSDCMQGCMDAKIEFPDMSIVRKCHI